MRIKKNDTVIITAGKDKGKKGKIIQIFATENKVVVEGLNVRKKNVRPKKQGEQGQVISFSAPIDASNVMVWNAKHGKGTRVAFSKDAQGKKIRINKKDGSAV